MKTMDGWVKYLSNGRKEEGYDYLVENRQASWINGEQDIVGVDLSWSLCPWSKISLHLGPGEYWQSDTYVSRLNLINAKDIMVKRRIMMRIDERHVGKTIVRELDFIGGIMAFKLTDDENIIKNKPAMALRTLNKRHVDTWFTIEIDNKGALFVSFKDRK